MTPHCAILGSGPLVLMLHGIGGGNAVFAPQMTALANAGYRAAAWDAPGYGASADLDSYTFAGLAERCVGLIEALLDGERAGQTEPRRAAPSGESPLGGQRSTRSGERGGKSITLIGHSMGGMVAQELMVRRPDLVKALVLCGTSSSFGRKSDGSPAEEWAKQFLRSRTAPLQAGKTMAQMAETLVPSMMGSGPAESSGQGAWATNQAIRIMGEVSARTYQKALECLLTFDRATNLAAIAVPTLLICGSQDKVASSASMQQMHRAIAGSVFHEIQGAGHLLNLEAPQAFNAVVLNFLASSSQAPSAQTAPHVA